VTNDFRKGAEFIAGSTLPGTLDRLDRGDFSGALESLVGGPTAMAMAPMKKAARLPMDQASRMARAREMGFITHMPVYHGRTDSFIAFAPSQAGRMTGAAPAREAAAWVSPDPEIANDFAHLAGRGRQDPSSQVYPLLHRAERPVTVELDGDKTNLEVAGTLRDLFEAGHNSVMLKNYTTPSGEKAKKIIAVRDPEQLRSVFAKFDPANINSRDLLAGLAGLGILLNQIEREKSGGNGL
jgi:hypothetical protein